MAQTTTAADPGVVVAPIPGWAVVALLAVAALALWLVTFDNGQLGSVLAGATCSCTSSSTTGATSSACPVTDRLARPAPSSRRTVLARFDFRVRAPSWWPRWYSVPWPAWPAPSSTPWRPSRASTRRSPSRRPPPRLRPAPGADHADGDDEDVSVSRGDQRGAGLFAAYALTGSVRPVPRHRALSLRTTTASPGRRVGRHPGRCRRRPWLKYRPTLPPSATRHRGRARAAVRADDRAGRPGAGGGWPCRRACGAGWPDDRRVAAVVVAGLVTFGVLFAALPPSPDTVGVPANLVWQFRLNSLTGNLLVWTLLTLGLGVVWTEAAQRRGRPSAPLRTRCP